MKRLYALLPMNLIFIGLLSGCGTVPSAQVDVEPMPADGQQVVYTRGIPMMRSVGESTTVIISPIETPRRQNYRSNFWISVQNNSTDQSFDFAIEDINVQYNGTSSRILSHAEVKNEAYAALQDRKILVALAYSSQSLNADQAATSQISGIGTPAIQVYDPAKAQQIRMQAGNQLQVDKIEAESEFLSEVGALEGYIRRDTIAPGETFGGYFLFNVTNFQYGKANNVSVAVTAGNENHQFRFREYNLGLNPSEIESAVPSDEDQPEQEDAPRNIFEGEFLNGRKLWGS